MFFFAPIGRLQLSNKSNTPTAHYSGHLQAPLRLAFHPLKVRISFSGIQTCFSPSVSIVGLSQSLPLGTSFPKGVNPSTTYGLDDGLHHPATAIHSI